MAKKAKQPKPKGRHRVLKVLLVLFLVALIGVFTLGATLLMSADEWAQLDPDKIENVGQSLQIFDQNGELIARLHGGQDRIKVSIDTVPEYVQNAFIAIEDARFYQHPGVDVRRILSALWQDLKSMSFSQGASTITQQLVKLSHLTTDKTIVRKLKEAVMALQLEQRYSKKEILEMYVNFIYYGRGAYGIESAAQAYFGKSVGELTLAEGAMLAGVINGPGIYAPHLHPDNALKRRNLVLDQMAKYEFITAEQAEAAKAEELIIVESAPANTYPHGFFVEPAMTEAKELMGISDEELYSGGYRIYTSMDPELQSLAETIYENGDLFPPAAEDGTLPESAFVMMDAKSGAVKALIGGRSYTVQRGLNRATQMRRQPGSTIKPIMVYAPALTLGHTTVDFLLDAPYTVDGYTPQNFGHTFRGWVTLREALASSLNVPAVRLFEEIGVEAGKTYAESVDIPFEDADQNLSLALGGFTTGVTPVELCQAYTAFANGGLYSPATLVERIEDGEGNVLYENPKAQRRVLSEQDAFIMNTLLESVVKEGTGTRLQLTGVPLAAKTGTVDLAGGGGNKDVWVTAYNSELVGTVWMGFDNTDEAHHLSSATGGNQPARLMAAVFAAYYEGRTGPEFLPPEGVREVPLDKKALEERQQVLLATSLTPADQIIAEWFKDGDVPEESTDYWNAPLPPDDLTVQDQQGAAALRFTPPSTQMSYRIIREDEDGGAEILTELAGSGPCTYLDETVEPGRDYVYYVVGVHPELKDPSGQPLTGGESNRVTFTTEISRDDPPDQPTPSPSAGADGEGGGGASAPPESALPSPSPPPSALPIG
ncbi:transglycosylase domain-containing protein [Gehongia tenuis]|uniref:Penicillin-binding protein 1A n=1 Tax=Gehongia tenuis TaxID=2763655 RepID=A0A926HNI8_9FIRM|nr:PBP1A family penicillin-binding protein [Gehongia tenuis]MBC8530659.1 PBP1A family penicillin-binding protein [Gehongia tenuis]